MVYVICKYHDLPYKTHDFSCQSALAFKLVVDDNYLQVTLATNGKSADFSVVEEEPWKCEN